MRFSATAHRNGLLRWAAEDVALAIGDGTGARPVTSEGYLPGGQAYRFLDRPLAPDHVVSLYGLRPWPQGRAIAWYEETQTNGMLRTDLWVSEGDHPRRIHLAHVPDWGSYHRFVVDAGNLNWTENVILRSGRDTIRFIDGVVYGPWSRGLVAEEGTQSNYQATEEVTHEPLIGRFLEVIAVGSDGPAARVRALALLGHINLMLGPQSYGRIVIDAEIDARRGHPQSYVLLSSHQLGFRVSVDEIALDTALADVGTLSTLSAKSRAMVALERYAQGSSAVVDELRFAAFVSGIDAVVTAFYSERDGGDLGRERRKRADRLAAERLQGLDKDTIARIKSCVISPSFLDRFKFYVDTNGLG